MAEKLSFLLIEDSQADFLLLKRHCERHGLDVSWHRVESQDQLHEALSQPGWDLALSDYSVPGLVFTEVFKWIRAAQPDLPVILISGHVGEETAVHLLKLGIRDFLLKDKLNRLVPAIFNALRETQEVRARKIADGRLEQAIVKLRKSEEFQSAILNSAIDAIITVTEEGIIESCNPAFETTFGFHREAVLGKNLTEVIIPPHYQKAHLEGMARLKQGEKPKILGKRVEVSARHANGSEFPVEIILNYLPEVGRYTAFLHDISKRKRQEEMVATLLAEKEAILENALVGIVLLRHRQIVSCNKRLEEIFGYPPGEMIGQSTRILYPSEEVFISIGAEAYPTVSRGVNFSKTLMLRRRDGSTFWGELTGRAIDPSQPQDGSIWIYSDITERKNAEAELAIAAIAFNSQEGMVVTDAEGVILRVNQAFTKTTGYSEAEAIGQTPRFLKSGRHDQIFYRDMWDTVKRTGSWQGEIWDRRKNGEEYMVWLTISSVKDNDGVVTNYVGTQFDITDRKQAEERIQHLAFFDQLTGLPNRTLLLDRLKQAMTASLRNGNHCALLLADLDDFKNINDSLGHEAGDAVLKEVARRLTECIRDDDTVARLGSDEFLLMLVGLSKDQTEAATQVELIGEKILVALNQPHSINDQAYQCTPSIGATLFKGQDASVDNLLKQADLAMYRAKSSGRNMVRFFDPEMETAVTVRARLEGDLRDAVQKEQFLLHYQPQVTSDGAVTGTEVLVRWQHPQRGMVSPAQFIPLSEETGLILPLGKWVLETSCRQLVKWASQPKMSNIIVAVNVSARQFKQPDFVEQTLEVLNKTGANPERLKLELTESMLVENLQDIIEKMSALKARGVGFSLDDFGTGYSSLSYLKRLPLDQLKIDQSFVRDVLSDPNDAAIARTIVALAQSLGLAVIAEGVETANQRDFLADSGCHAYQGYFFSRPLALEGFEAFVQRDVPVRP